MKRKKKGGQFKRRTSREIQQLYPDIDIFKVVKAQIVELVESIHQKKFWTKKYEDKYEVNMEMMAPRNWRWRVEALQGLIAKIYLILIDKSHTDVPKPNPSSDDMLSKIWYASEWLSILPKHPSTNQRLVSDATINY
ncbi:hypothetical protein WA026_011650 [Henosepilachna vigintioctopunctata]|uniref:Uncharacterized protein n=1 Tax=Henosepilachna vigintioctopunctata TaxID=420089 RepID=A0AAW1TTH4_9CUCU